MIDWVPVFLIVFKAIAFGTCMFFAIKWHYEQDSQKHNARAVVRAGATVVALLVLAAALLLWITWTVASKLGMDLG